MMLKTRSRLMVVCPLILVLILSVGCSQRTPSLTIFAAAGAKAAIDEICAQFTEKHGARIEINYGGGGEVLSKMLFAGSGDVYIAPESRFMDSAVEKQAIDSGTIKRLAYMIPVIAVPKGNPKSITCLSDMAKPGVRVAITRTETTLLGKFALDIFEKAGLSEQIEKNIITTASDPNNLLAMFTTDSIDAGITWNYFGTSASDKLEIIWLQPEQLTGVGEMQAAVSIYSRNTEMALKLVDFLASFQGKEIFRNHGYITDDEEVKQYWK